MLYHKCGCVFPGVPPPGGNAFIGYLLGLDEPRRPPLAHGIMMLKAQLVGEQRSPGMHEHEELVHILSGSVRATVGEEEARLGAGDTLRVPPETRHQFRVAIDVVSPASLLFLQRGPPSSLRAEGVAPSSWCPSDAALRPEGEPQLLGASSLDTLSGLAPLTVDGCVLPTVQLARGKLNRDAVIAQLLPQFAADPLALKAFILTLNAHPEAHWWHNREQASEHIAQGVAKLLSLVNWTEAGGN